MEKIEKSSKAFFSIFLTVALLTSNFLVFAPEAIARTEINGSVACDPSVNLLVNGSFEEPVVTHNNGGWELYSLIPGWDLVAGDAIELQRNVFTSAEGYQHLELDSHGTNSASVVEQEFDTLPGRLYRLTFAWSPRPEGEATGSQVVLDVEVVSENGSPFTTKVITTGSGAINWQYETYEFTAIELKTAIKFSHGGPMNTYGGLVDDVQVYCQPVTIIAHKIVCEDEEDLPDWGNGGPNITANTAADYVAQHPNCHPEPDWYFQWGQQGSGDPGRDFYGEAGNGYMTFGPTDINGVTTATVNTITGSRLELREVLQNGYIPFTFDQTHQSNSDNVSAEFYCHNDVLNYDNWDYINSPQLDNTYYCVAFNAPVEEPTYQCSDGIDNDGDDLIDFPNDPGCSGPTDDDEYNEPEPTGSLTICKYEDKGVIGQYEEGIDTPLAWEMTVIYPTPGTLFTRTNGETGCVTIEGLEFGTHSITEATSTNWVRSYPESNTQTATIDCETPDPEVYFLNYEEPIVGPIPGCMDPEATNYIPDATVDDGSCTYPTPPPTGPMGGQFIMPPPGEVLGEEIVAECGIYLFEYIEYGASNNPEEVQKLQIFLNQHMGSNLAVTGVYDLATMNAVNQFQLQYKNEVLKPWVDESIHCDVNQPTGYVYKTTQRWINLIMCPTLNLLMPDLSGYPKADCAGYWGTVLGEEIVPEEDGVPEGEVDESEESMTEGEEEVMPEGEEEEMPFEAEVVTQAPEAEERGTSILWLIVIIILVAAVAIWFVYKGIKK